MFKALVLASNLQQAEELHREIAAAKITDVSFIYPAKVTSEVASPRALLEDCYDLIKTEKVDIVVSLRPGLDLVHAALLKACRHLKGPSCESVFLCLHKLYARQTTVGLLGLPYAAVDLDDADEETVSAAFERLGGTRVYVQDCVKGVVSRKLKEGEFKKGVGELKADVVKVQGVYNAFFNSYIDRRKYPLSVNNMVVLEQYWEVVSKDISVHLVEACVNEGEFIPWVISDVTHSRHKARCVDKVSIPTKLNGFVQMQVWGVMREVVQRLVGLGFDSHFINATVLTSLDGLVRVADVNTCIVHENTGLYKHVYQNGDNVRAQIQLLCGEMLRTPRILDRKFASRGSIVLFTEDITTKDALNLKEAKANQVELLVSTNESWRTKRTDFGTRVARFTVLGASEEECEGKMMGVLRKVLKEPKHTNWSHLMTTTTADAQSSQTA